MFLAVLVTLFLTITSVYPFLAVNRAVPADLLVVEGWLPEYALKEAVEEFNTGRYRMIVTTGSTIERGFCISQFKTYSELGAATLKQFGLNEAFIIPVPTPPVKKDRTYASAVAVKKWLRSTGLSPKGLNVYSFGPHARRSWLLFKKAFGNEMEIGILNTQSLDYDSSNWWQTSSGVRAVINEIIAYCYARFFFYPKNGHLQD